MAKNIATRATRSVIALTSRTFFLNVVNFLGAFALTIFLSPKDFGIFIITSTIVDILTYFSDIGLAGALIQKKKKLKKSEISATFTIQMGLVLFLIVVAFIFRYQIKDFYELDQIGLVLLYALLLSFFLSSLKTIPSVLSERKLRFNNIVIPQVIEALAFNSIIVVLAWQGFGVKSYIWAVLARALSGTIAIYILVPWKPSLSFNFKAVKGLLNFGIPFQANSLIAVFKDRVSLLILAKIIGVGGMGILGWAEKWANLPLRYFLDSMVKVSFPLFSRLQHDLEKAKQALEQSVHFITVMVFPSLAGAYLLMPQIIDIIPKYSKWEPGLSTFNLFLISAAIASVSTFLTNFLTAIGKVKTTMGLMFMWATLTLTLYPLFAYKFGYHGVAIASITVALTSIVPYLMVRKIVKVDLFRPIAIPLLASLVMLAVLSPILPNFKPGLVKLIGTIISGGVIYGAILYILDGKRLSLQIRKFIAYAKQ
ncbi:oligosaccharide flippase family protein [Candidatus Beckwithbacteria bacterium]|nr:oligosaccharide flippase family protein [Candidatus Beckwithbacteria bacterium]